LRPALVARKPEVVSYEARGRVDPGAGRSPRLEGRARDPRRIGDDEAQAPAGRFPGRGASHRQGGDRGRFTFYRLSKRGLGTLEAIEAICRRWNIAGGRLNYGGLKDRHAVTVQYMTILDGPPREMHQTHFDLEPLGRLAHPYGPAHFRGNRFVVVLRDLASRAVEQGLAALRELPRDGLPNYFDDQRFGSVGFDGGFIAQAWLAGDHERALRLAIAEPNASDRPDTKVEKESSASSGGAGPRRRPASAARTRGAWSPTWWTTPPISGGLRPGPPRIAVALFLGLPESPLEPLLARLIERTTRPEQRILIDFKLAALPIHRGLDPEQAVSLAGWRIPLPAARTPLPDGPARDLALEVVGELGLSWDDLRVRHLKDVFFSKGVAPRSSSPRT
jgi:tRNA pseudouridine13 synthase